MNRINFTATENFPLSSDTMELMQKITKLSATTALLGGLNYILSGCEDDGFGVISDGVIVIDGELLPFQGGPVGTKITIQETPVTLSALGNNYPEAYVYRVAKFGPSGEYLWSNFKNVVTNQALETLFKSIKGDAPGIVKMWAGLIAQIPPEYKLCNGDELLVNDYPDLFKALGTAFGGNGTTTFKLPDLRGKFIAGFDNSNLDYNQVGKTGGEEKHTLTISEMPEHTHTYDSNNLISVDLGGFVSFQTSFIDPVGNEHDTSSTGNGNSHENRPPYFTLAYIIKVVI